MTTLRRALLVALVMVAITVGAAPAVSSDKVIFGLDWQVFGRHAGYFVALDKGFYAKEGLDVEIQRGYGSADAVKRVASGAVTLGFGDTGSLVLARPEGMKVKVVGMVYGKGPYALWVRKDANIKTPHDLEGKTLGGNPGSGVRTLFPAFATKAGFDAEKVKWATVDAASLYPMLFAKRIDGMIDFLPGWATASKRATEARVPLERIVYADYGLDIYSNGILAREETLRDKPDLVRKFVKATMAGLDYAFKNPGEAAQILRKRFPELDADSIEGEIAIVQDLAVTESTRKNGLGYMSPQKMTFTRDVIAEAYKMNQKPAVDDLYTNEFLPR